MLPYQKQLAALKYLVPDLEKLSRDAEHEWLIHGDSSDEMLLKSIINYDNRAYDLESRYTGNIYFPTIKRIHELAGDKNKNFFEYRHASEEGGDAVES